MIAVVPAIANAVAHAIGKRFYNADHAGARARKCYRSRPALSLTVSSKPVRADPIGCRKR